MEQSDGLDAEDRKVVGLLLIGYSWHTGSPRMGDKAHAARWALGDETELPMSYDLLVRHRGADPSGIEHLEGLLDESG